MRTVCLLLLIASAGAVAQMPSVRCGFFLAEEIPSGFFEEGIDEYIVNLQTSNGGGFLSKLVGAIDNQIYSLEVRIPKLHRDGENVLPNCFLATANPLLFSCTKGAVSPGARLTNHVTSTTRSIDFDHFAITAARTNRLRWNLAPKPWATDSMQWEFEMKIGGTKIADQINFTPTRCRTEK